MSTLYKYLPETVLQRFAAFFLDHTAEHFAYVMQDVSKDWPGYLSEKYRVFCFQPLLWWVSFSPTMQELIAQRIMELPFALNNDDLRPTQVEETP